MPIKTGQSKDIPGKEGYSVRDVEKIMDVVNNPEKYGVDPSDNGGDDGKEGCPVKLFQFLLLVATFGPLFFN